MRLLPLIASLSIVASIAFAQENSSHTSSAAVIREMNAARTNPAAYAEYLEELRASFVGNVMVLPGGTRLRTKEGTHAIDEAIGFLRHAQPVQPLAVSTGMCRAAADHCADQAGGGFGHGGSDRSNPATRINRYGMCTGGWGENISYGKSNARDVVIALIVDDGQPARKHRKNIFNPSFNCAGASFGRHATFGSMCSIEYSGGYVERDRSAEPLVARN